MAKAKRKHQAHSRTTTARKKSHERNEVQIIKTSSPFDQLCDNTLLRILSYSNDLRSVFFLTRCTSKNLRNRFCPKKEGTSASENKDQQCPKIWQSIFSDLHMTPLDEANKSLDYFDAIGYRLSLYNTLTARDKRANAKGNNAAKRCYTLPLRNYYLKPLPESWQLQLDNEDDQSSETLAPLMQPFALLSGGSGEEFVLIDPEYHRIDVRESILDCAICLDKCVQKKAVAEAVANEAIYGPETLEETMDDSHRVLPGVTNQTLITTYIHSLKRGDRHRLISDDWEDYFGAGTPFFSARDEGGHQNHRRPEIAITGATISTFDLMDEERNFVVEKKILMTRIMMDTQNQDNVCMELVIWGGRGLNNEKSGSGFVLRNVCRVPGEWYCADVCLNAKHLYVSFDEDCSRIPGDYHPPIEDVKRAVFRFPISNSQLDGGSCYPEPDCFFLTDYDVATMLSLAGDILLVGTKQGTIEIWNTGMMGQDQSVPCLIQTLQNPFPLDGEESPLPIGRIFEFGDQSLQYGFVSIQEDTVHGTIVSFWQPLSINLNKPFDVADAKFQVATRIKYDCYAEISAGGRGLTALGYDRFGCLYLDIYNARCSRFVPCESDEVNIPKGVEMAHLDPNEERCIHFANRIKIQHRVEVESHGLGLGFPERLIVDGNDRFIIICANDGLSGSNGDQKSGPGLIVVDLEEVGK